jgi:nitrile hydratase alpha subunit/nitrile hydratase beta subunit
MADHDHDHPHEHSELSETQLRVRALETILTEKGYIDPAALDAIVETYETKVGPRNGARVVAKAWTDPAFKQALLKDATAAVGTLGHVSPVGDHLVAVENTPQRHNMIVCTLCSCYPWEMLGLPPVWYKSAPYRSRAVKDPRGVLADFGVKLSKETDIRVWDSTAETRRSRHPRFDDRHGLGTHAGGDRQMNGVHDMGGMDGFGKVEVEENEPPFHATWEGRVLAMQRAMGYAGAWHIDDSRYAQETLPPQTYLAVSYYQRWELAMEKNLLLRGYVTEAELKAGRALGPTKPLPRKLTKDVVDAGMTRNSFFRQQQGPARFKPGDRVRTRNINPLTHTRLPRYARDKVGTVELIHGCHAYPDSVATDRGDDPQWLYTVVFDGREIWGPDTDPTLTISIDAFEPYLEPA